MNGENWVLLALVAGGFEYATVRLVLKHRKEQAAASRKAAKEAGNG